MKSQYGTQGEGSLDSAAYVVLCLDELRIALRLAVVERVIQAVALTPLPGAPEIVLGVLNLQGRLVPVVDLRRRFGLPARVLAPSDHLLIARTRQRPVALVADAVSGVSACAAPDWVDAGEVLPGLALIDGLVRRKDGLLLVHDLERFLSLDEAARLDAVLADAGGP